MQSKRIKIEHPVSPIDFCWSEPGLAEVTRRSPMTGREHTMLLPITVEQVEDHYGKGLTIQGAFPNLDPSQREFLLTGYTQDDWDSMFPNEE